MGFRSSVVASLLAAAVVVTWPSAAGASFPGGNGYIYLSAADEMYNNYDIYRVRPDGTGLKNLTEDITDYAETPSSSVNATKISFTIGTQATSDVWIMNGDGSNKERVTSSPGVPIQNLDQMAGMSADGELVTFMSTRDTTPGAVAPDYDLYMANAEEDGAVTQLLNHTGEEYYPEFTPDGETVVYYGEPVSGYDIGKLPVAGAPHTTSTSLTPGTGLQERLPSVSPDGTTVAFQQNSANLLSVGIDGGALTTLIDDADVYTSPSYSPDGEKIVFTDITDDTLEIANADGSNPEPIPLSDLHPSSPDWSADTLKPKAKITSGPKGTTSKDKASFAFKSNEAGSSFECKLDRGGFEDCSSKQAYKNLKAGEHKFQVRATDFAANRGKPAKRTWKVL